MLSDKADHKEFSTWSFSTSDKRFLKFSNDSYIGISVRLNGGSNEKDNIAMVCKGCEPNFHIYRGKQTAKSRKVGRPLVQFTVTFYFLVDAISNSSSVALLVFVSYHSVANGMPVKSSCATNMRSNLSSASLNFLYPSRFSVTLASSQNFHASSFCSWM